MGTGGRTHRRDEAKRPDDGRADEDGNDMEQSLLGTGTTPLLEGGLEPVAGEAHRRRRPADHRERWEGPGVSALSASDALLQGTGR